MGKGDWRRPTGPQFDENFCKTFPKARGCVAAAAANKLEEEKAERRQRADLALQRSAERTERPIALTLDQLRTIVFETSRAYADKVLYDNEQEAEWSRAAALKVALERLGYDREAEMVGGAA